MVPKQPLHRQVLGTGAPMLLMHGGLGWDHTLFRPWLDPLADDLQLIYYDHRGNGRSPRPADPAELDHESWVADADALRAELGHEEVILFGHSYGGFLALEYALRHPGRVRGLVLACTAQALDYPDVIGANAASRGTPEQLEAVGAAFAGPVADDVTFERILRTILPLYFHRAPAGAEEKLLEDTVFSAGAFNRAFFGCVAGFDVEDRLGELDMPVLILGGRHDWIMPPAHSTDRLAAGIPGARVHMFEHSGHFPWVEQPEELVRVLGRWAGEL